MDMARRRILRMTVGTAVGMLVYVFEGFVLPDLHERGSTYPPWQLYDFGRDA